jgi:L-rhamnonate dehydratase
MALGGSGVSRRRFLGTLTAAGAFAGSSMATDVAAGVRCPDRPDGLASLKIDAVELVELHGHYTEEAGVDHQPQVNPLDVYDELRPAPYMDKPDGTRDVQYEAIYIRIRTAAGLEGLYGPIEREPATIVLEDLRHFLIGKDALAGEVVWDQMYRSNRHSRAGIFLMAVKAVDNALWDMRGKFYGVPVWRLLGGPSREKVEMYASALGFSLELDAVRKRAMELKDQGFRYQKWFMGYGPGSGPEGMRKNIELVKTLRETLGEDYEIMFDAYSGVGPGLRSGMGAAGGAVSAVLDGGGYASGEDRQLRRDSGRDNGSAGVG